MNNLEHEIKNARLRFNSLSDLAQSLPSAPDTHLQEALNLISESLEELETLQEELRSGNEELELAWDNARTERGRYQELFDFAPDGYVLTDRHGTIRELNLVAATLLNVARDFAIGKPLAVFVEASGHKAFYLGLTEALMRGRVKNWILELRPREKPPIHVSVTVSAKNLVEGELELRWLLRDITEQKNSEAMLREETEGYRSLFENTLEGLSRSTPEGRFTAVNAALARLLGYQSPEQMLSLQIPQDIFIDPAERARLLADVESSPEGALRGREVLLKKKDGQPLVASVSIKAIRDSHGRTVAYESQVQDISERKALEERLRKRERLAAVGATVAVLAHEISNPLTGMCTTIEMMARYLTNQGVKDENLASFLGGLKTETQRLASLLHDFRMLAQYQYSFKPVFIHEIVEEVLKIQPASNSIKIEVDLAENLPAINADRNKLKQALLNLWKNAMEAMPSGGTLKLKAAVSGERLLIAMKDTGQGIRQGLDIFEPFTTTKEDGTGLGLAIVRQVALAHGGNVTYSSHPGRGTTFHLSLPINPPDAPASSVKTG